MSEHTPPGSLVESFTVMENPDLFRGVSCRLMPREAGEYFELGQGRVEKLRAKEKKANRRREL